MPIQMNKNKTILTIISCSQVPDALLIMRYICPLQLVPIGDKQVFFIRTDSQLTDAASVTLLLDQVAQKGSYRAVFSLDFQAFGATDTVRHIYMGL